MHRMYLLNVFLHLPALVVVVGACEVVVAVAVDVAAVTAKGFNL